MAFPTEVKYNEEHFHEKEGALFIFKRYRDEGFWSILDGKVDMDEIYARLHNEKGDIERYVPVQEYLKAVCEEGLYYPGFQGDVGIIIAHYRTHCKQHGIEVPETWNLSEEDMTASLVTAGMRISTRNSLIWASVFVPRNKK